MWKILTPALGGRLLVGALLAGGIWAGWSSLTQTGHAQPAAPAAGPKFAYLGTASCSSTACHNNGGPAGSPRSEYSTWMIHDKHIRAYDALLTTRSKHILMNLRGIKDIKDAHPQKDLTCLQCHAMDPHGAQRGETIAFEDGIGCERCHGPAQKWLGEHFTAGWKAKTNEQKAALGFVPTRSLTARAQMCVDCHVGTSDLDVNHDLIAAGHPRLMFEYSSYLANMPPHWDAAAEKQRQPDLEARSWAAGQVISAHKALELLAFRAKADPQNPNKVWPEFAEYDCYACHNPIQFSRKAPQGDKPAGSMTVCDWYWTMVPRALNLARSPDAAKVQAALEDLRKEMSQAAPDREKVAAQAQAAAALLQQSLASVGRAPSLDAGSLRKVLADIVAEESARADKTWDRGAQAYLAVTALHQALCDLDPAQRTTPFTGQLRDLSSRLRFRPGFDSPRADDLADFWARFARLPLR